MFTEEIQKQGYSCMSLEYSYDEIEKFPTYEKSFIFTNQILYTKKELIMHEYEALDGFQLFKEKWESTFADSIDFPTLESVNNLSNYINKMSEVFIYLLVKKKTKAVFLIPYYNADSHALILAARKLGIPSIDIQHGIQRGPFYSRWDSLSKQGYNTMPTYFWCWRKNDQLKINNWADKNENHSAICGGNPWVDFWKKSKHPLIIESDAAINNVINEEEVNILVTLQPLYGLKGWKCNIPNSLVEAIKNSPANWKWFIRYHHSMFTNYTEEINRCEQLLCSFIKSGKVEVKYANKFPLMALLRKIQIHITAFSSSIIEAISLGVPSVVLHEEAIFLYGLEYESGWIEFADEWREINSKITTLLNKDFNNIEVHKDIKEGCINEGLKEIFKDVQQYSTSLKVNSLNKSVLKKIYFAEGEFSKVISLYELDLNDEDAYITGRAYEMLSLNEMALNCYRRYLIYSKKEQADIRLFLMDLLNIRNFLIKIKKYNDVREIDEIIYNKINWDENLTNIYVKSLFDNNKYQELVLLSNSLNKTLDYYYFVGRSMLSIGMINEGRELLINYLEILKSEVSSVNGISKQLNYQISACFYLGEISLKQNDKKSAINFFTICVEKSGNQHIKAKEYLNYLRNN